jgi:hypothetical protein
MEKLRISRLARLAVFSAAVASCALAGLASGASTPPVVVPDGVASCMWLKIRAKATGYELRDDDAGLGPKHTFSADCYLQLVFMPPDGTHLHGRYGGPLLCPVDAVQWQASSMEDSFSGTALQDGNVIAADDYLTFTNAAGDIIQGYGTHRLLITVDKTTQAFKKAIFQTLGGEMIHESLFNETFMTVTGGYAATGTSVTPDKVPQPAKDLVSGSPCP